MDRLSQLSSQDVERRGVGLRPGTNDEIDRREEIQELSADHLTEPALEPISLDTAVLVLRHNKADPGMKQTGSDSPELEMLGPDALPVSCHDAQVRTPREPMASREAQRLRRRRTSLAA